MLPVCCGSCTTTWPRRWISAALASNIQLVCTPGKRNTWDIVCLVVSILQFFGLPSSAPVLYIWEPRNWGRSWTGQDRTAGNKPKRDLIKALIPFYYVSVGYFMEIATWEVYGANPGHCQTEGASVRLSKADSWPMCKISWGLDTSLKVLQPVGSVQLCECRL